ncbi:RNA polymerase sigma-70 factor (ECF subfamily) [Roseimicrobium gellanilyticum]|uniref:RNA polymerase sigma-70 factor (ECF subfamily) n=1 Tax=Roseimicrobium gellanilyticum TaxID=748857 RepID=A0A366H8Q5_9BACT|nr:sigma-70 family RNA polymerase sigma factor [Roseimicrobium gellanilyticum]RBP38608.1 RNA polymerase sigma-70 factor (ECF subfamily) [Roseimicrobium gellanilyticum]
METGADTDASAMSRLAAGEDMALTELMHRWQDRVASFLLRMTGSHATAGDLAQETFVRLYQNRTRYKPSASFSSYIFSIAANLARNHHRWSARHPADPIHELQKDGKEPTIDDSSPDEALARSETADAVQRAVQDLPPDLRETLVLFTYHDLGYHEIASAVGCSRKAVETRLYRARQTLKEKLQHLASSPVSS